MTTLLRDAIRGLARAPGVAGLVLLVLTIGIGAAIAIFALVDAVLLKPLPYPDANRLVAFTYTFEGRVAPRASATKFNVWQTVVTGIEDHAAVRFGQSEVATADGLTQQHAGRVSAAFFRLFATPFDLGRPFTDAEDQPGRGEFVVLSHGYWLRRFGGDRSVVGQQLTIDGRPRTIVGVAARGFDTSLLGEQPDLWLPIQIAPDSLEHPPFLQAFGRLRPGTSIEAARDQEGVAAAEFRRRFPEVMASADTFRSEPFVDLMLTDLRRPIGILGGAVGLVLLLGCANVAGLMLIRGARHRQELAVRRALGATRLQIAAPLLVEGLVLSGLATGFGIVLGIDGIRALVSLAPGTIPRIGDGGSGLVADWRLAAFACVVSIATALACTMLPALASSSASPVSMLRDGSSGTTPHHRKGAMSLAALVTGEIALAVVLTIGAGLLARTWWGLDTADRGFDPDNVVTMRLSPGATDAGSQQRFAELIQAGVARLGAVPGVTGSAATCCLPLESDWRTSIQIAGRPVELSADALPAERLVSPAYFAVLRIPVVRGRAFDDSDSPTSPRVAIINQAMAQRFWPGGNPLGEQIVLFPGRVPDPTSVVRTIVGIVGDVRDGWALSERAQPTVYVPLAQRAAHQSDIPLAWMVRHEGTSTFDRTAAERALREASGGRPVFDISDLDAIAATAIAGTSFHTMLLALFSGSALLMTAIGVYGALADSVHQRRREMGIRLALGARSSRLRRRVLAESLRLAAVGIAIGVLAALGLMRLLDSLLFGISARDPLVFLAVPLAIAALAIGSAWAPARWISRLDPAQILRQG